MVDGLRALPRLVGRHDGANGVRYVTSAPGIAVLYPALATGRLSNRSWLLLGICAHLCTSSAPPDLGRATPVHSDVFRQYRLDAVLRAGAPKHPAHPHILDRANGSTGLVSRLVLPHGVDGVAICSQFRHEPGNGLDEWM
ncbi:hypothetical protein LTR12_007164, partial [Friedmanniomyces endolithicus]